VHLKGTTLGDLNMPGTPFRSSIAVLGIIAVVGAIACTTSGDAAIASQPGDGSGPCWHVGVSDYECPDSTMVVGPDYVRSVSITVETTDGKRFTKRLPAGVDAIFLTRQSTEKFLLSYYWATNREKAEALSRELTAIKGPAATK
jgi:hypothetical protein